MYLQGKKREEIKMSAILLMMSGTHRLNSITKKEPLKDTGTCLNCIYQGTGSEKCAKCDRSSVWKYYRKPKDTKDNFKIKG